MVVKEKIVVGLLFLSLFLSSSVINAADKGKPNILFIISEDNGPEISCYGSPVPTPHLDKLAKEGVLFKNAYVPQAGCSPSRAAFLTGLYPHQNGQIGLATWKYHMYDQDIPNIVNHLKSEGYRTGMLGKLHVNPEEAFDFDWWEISEANFKRNNLDRYADLAGQFMSDSEKPFYLQVNYPDAHRPFLDQVQGLPEKPLAAKDVKPLPYMGLDNTRLREETAGYYNSMMRLDHLVGDILMALKASGKYENTLIVYIGDHGADILRGKRTCYEGGLKIPMIISFPDKVVKNETSRSLVSSIDLYPTFLEAAKLKIPSYLPGKSLWPVLSGEGRFERKYLFTEYHVHSNHNPYPQRAVRDKRFKLIHNLVYEEKNPGYDFTINHFRFDNVAKTLEAAPKHVQSAYDRMKHPPEFELYDLQNDPYEWYNLANDKQYKNVLNRLKKVLRKWQRRSKDPLIDKDLANRLFQDVVNTNIERVDIPYDQYMNWDYFGNKKK